MSDESRFRSSKELDDILKIARYFGLNGCAAKLYDLNKEIQNLKAELDKSKTQLAEAEGVIERLNNEATGKEYGLDAEDIWEISKQYYSKYKGD